MRWRTVAGLALVLAGLESDASAQSAAPTYARRDGGLVVHDLPVVLARPEVRPHLTSGLTTSFVLRVTATPSGDGEKVRGAARVDVRWELWDEVYLVHAIDATGQVSTASPPTLDDLLEWWRGFAPLVAREVPAGPLEVEVELSVLPFSQSEQRDAQRWFSGELAPGGSTAARAGEGEGEAPLDNVVDLLIATSIQRRRVVRYEWQAVPPPPPRE